MELAAQKYIEAFNETPTEFRAAWAELVAMLILNGVGVAAHADFLEGLTEDYDAHDSIMTEIEKAQGR